MSYALPSYGSKLGHGLISRCPLDKEANISSNQQSRFKESSRYLAQNCMDLKTATFNEVYFTLEVTLVCH